MSIASVSIVGNLVKAPQQVQFESGKIKTTMVVAVNTPVREKRGGESADFYQVETWGKLAELVATRLTKGNQVTANGRLLMSKWKDKQGVERMTPTISALDIAFPQRAKNGEPASGGSVTMSVNNNITKSADEPELEQEEESEEEEEEEDSSSDSFGEPNRATRPAPMRRKSGGPS